MTSSSTLSTISRVGSLRFGRLEITGGFLLAAALLNYLDRGSLLLITALSAALHELGHYTAIRLAGGRVTCLRLSALGAEMRLSARRTMGHGAECLAALAGPGVNLLLAFAAAGMGERGYLPSGVNAALALFNLLPLRQLDGGRALWHLTAALCSPETADHLTVWTGRAALGALLAFGALQLWSTGYNFTLLLLALGLGGGLFRWRNKGRKSRFKGKFCLHLRDRCGKIPRS